MIYHSLNMHWAVVVPPGLLLGIGPLLVTVTTLEFISLRALSYGGPEGPYLLPISTFPITNFEFSH